MYTENDLVKIAKRENNKKRNYLVVNPFQGKHVPVEPKEALGLFHCLAEVIEAEYTKEALLLVGFAETATAIGAGVAAKLGAEYIQTTRETIPDVEYLFFSEEHSHATEQKLVKNDMDLAAGCVTRIIFVEDEVTTGKTIRNIISILKKQYPDKFKFSVLSLLNGMDEECRAQYMDDNIALHYLVKTDHSNYADLADGFSCDGTYHEADTSDNDSFQEVTISGYQNARRLVNGTEYIRACEKLWDDIKNKVELSHCKKVLVVGTEEFMYPALYVGARIEAMGVEVKSHSTTRSPIEVSSEAGYPLHERYELRSMYEKDRIVYLYDIRSYDKVIVITDSKDENIDGRNSLVNALALKNQDISVIRWC